MKAAYHRQITAQALAHFTPAALETVIRANLGQDAIRYQFVHPHFHYDSNSFAAGDAYIESRFRAALDTARAGDFAAAREEFGRLTHTAQDFYAHSNYVALWRELHPEAAPEQIQPGLPAVIKDPRLHSGKIYYPLELFSFFGALRPLVLPLLPRDSHAWMNKDDPGQPDFAYAFQAAARRTFEEWERLAAQLTPGEAKALSGESA
jgi:hypothetical protein